MKKRIFVCFICIVICFSALPIISVGAEQPPVYYGREALSKMQNGESLVFAYDQITAGILAGTAEIMMYDSTHSVTLEEATLVMEAYRNDQTSHFWFESGGSWSYEEGGKVISFHPVYTYTGETLAKMKTSFDAAVNALLAGITPGMSEFDKLLYLHDQLVTGITYTIGAPNAHNAYGAIVDGLAVCEGYAEALCYLLRRSGIEAFMVTGESRGEGHAWCMVKIGDHYYHNDPTWADQGDRTYYAYFNVTDAVIREDHTVTVPAYGLPACNSTAANYYTVKGGIFDTYTAESLGKYFKDHGMVAQILVTSDPVAFESWLADNIKAVAKAAGVTGGFSYGMSKMRNEYVLTITTTECAHQYDNDCAPICNLCGQGRQVPGHKYANACAALCLLCGAERAPNPHAWIWVIDTPANEAQTGLRHEECSSCGERRSEGTVIPKVEHVHKMQAVSAVDATCKNEGNISYYQCTGCKKCFEDQNGNAEISNTVLPIDPARHTGKTEVRGAVKSTTEAEGYSGDTHCADCGALLQKGSALPLKVDPVQAVTDFLNDPANQPILIGGGIGGGALILILICIALFKKR